jgi:hypothetical protein
LPNGAPIAKSNIPQHSTCVENPRRLPPDINNNTTTNHHPVSENCNGSAAILRVCCGGIVACCCADGGMKLGGYRRFQRNKQWGVELQTAHDEGGG